MHFLYEFKLSNFQVKVEGDTWASEGDSVAQKATHMFGSIRVQLADAPDQFEYVRNYNDLRRLSWRLDEEIRDDAIAEQRLDNAIWAACFVDVLLRHRGDPDAIMRLHGT